MSVQTDNPSAVERKEDEVRLLGMTLDVQAAVLSTLGFSTLLTRLHMVSLLQKVQIAVLIPSPRRVLNFSAWPAQKRWRSTLSITHTCLRMSCSPSLHTLCSLLFLPHISSLSLLTGLCRFPIVKFISRVSLTLYMLTIHISFRVS